MRVDTVPTSIDARVKYGTLTTGSRLGCGALLVMKLGRSDSLRITGEEDWVGWVREQPLP